ncbi:MAG: phosphoglycerate dehydrogenase [Halioglobus sp.]
MKILITCPPMLRVIEQFRPLIEKRGAQLTTPDVVQTLTVPELLELVPEHDGWIIGDDSATREVFERAKSGKLKAAVKWGIGVDNVDLKACEDLGIPVTNTPNMFGAEVADLALGYIIALARRTFEIDRGVRAGLWRKPQGISLAGKTVAILGFGDVGKHLVKRALAVGMKVVVYDPFVDAATVSDEVVLATWPQQLGDTDFVVVTCALTPSSEHMINSLTLAAMKPGVRIVNVSRGGIIEEPALIEALAEGQVYSAALDVFEQEPLPTNSSLLAYPRCVFGSHNASNTSEAVVRTSQIAIEKLFDLIEEVS